MKLSKFFKYPIPLLSGLLITSCMNYTNSQQFCGETTNGETICIKKSTISCWVYDNMWTRQGPFGPMWEYRDIKCRSAGRKIDLAGYESHWNEEAPFPSCLRKKWDPRDASYIGASKENTNNFSCVAADHFNLINPNLISNQVKLYEGYY